MRKPSSQKGTILLTTALVLSFAMIIVFSIIGRATTDVDISKQLEETAQALSAAEAGIEQVLKTGVEISDPQTIDPESGLTVQTFIEPYGGSSGSFEFPNAITTDSVATLWLADHNDDGSLDTDTAKFTDDNTNFDVCWSESGSEEPAMLMALYYKTAAGEYRVSRAAFDSESRNPANNFGAAQAPGGNNCGASGTYHSVNINVESVFNVNLDPDPLIGDVLLALRLRPVYNDAAVVIDPNGYTLPLQGNRIPSTGYTPSGIARTVVVYQEYVSPPLIFDAAVVSQSDLIH